MPEQNSNHPDGSFPSQQVPVGGQHGDSADERMRGAPAVPGAKQTDPT